MGAKQHKDTSRYLEIAALGAAFPDHKRRSPRNPTPAPSGAPAHPAGAKTAPEAKVKSPRAGINPASFNHLLDAINRWLLVFNNRVGAHPRRPETRRDPGAPRPGTQIAPSSRIDLVILLRRACCDGSLFGANAVRNCAREDGGGRGGRGDVGNTGTLCTRHHA